MKRLPGIMLRYVLVFYIPWTTTLLSVDAQVRLGCAEVEYLEVGKEGVVICSFEDFYSVTWYTKEDYDAKKSPLIHFNGNKDGLTAEYDVYPNGSFIIRNVTFNHSGRYVVTMLYDVTSNLVVHEVRVEVYVIPDPPYPVVDGHIHQQHVYMDVSRDGELSCSMRGVYPNVSLTWTVLDPSQSNKIQFQQDVIGKTQNEDKTYDIILSSMFQVTDPSIRRITIQCGVANEIGEYLSPKTKVDLLFSAVYPVVNGHVNQKHVYLDVDREGHLTCLKENVDVGTRVVWVLDPSMHGKVTFESNAIMSINIDGTVNINQTFDYEVHDHSLERITIECKVIEPDTDEHPYTTVVDLLFQNVYPVVNGHVNQKHVYLDVDREGHLTCLKENVDVGTRLVWVLDPNMRGKVNFESNAIISINNDGTVNINQTFDYKVFDNSLVRITIECKVIEPDTDEHPFTTTVQLLFSSALSPFTDPVISGCYHQEHSCSLEVEKKGELTCTVKNSHYLVDLKWTTLEGDEHLVFEEDRVRSQNNTNIFDMSITTPYFVIDDTVTSVTVQCDAYKSHSDQVLATAQTFLLIQTQTTLVMQTADDSNTKILFVILVAILGLFLVCTWLLLVITHYSNRKMYKCTEINNWSSDSPDSGNTGSNSSEKGGSEVSAKSGVINMSFCDDKQGSLDDKRGCSDGDSKV